LEAGALVTTPQVLGLALLLLAFVLFVVDLKVTNHGLPTVGGMGALILGGLTLFDASSPYFLASLITLVVVVLLMGSMLFVGVLSVVPAAKKRPVKTGIEGMTGEVGVVREPVGANSPGWVFVHGEWWRAIAALAPEVAYKQGHEQTHEQVIGGGQRVLVVGCRDRKVMVLPFEPVAFAHSPKARARRI
jgi:membrane-bound ClpP family serine protease